MNWIHLLPIGMVLGQLICGHCIGVNPSARDFSSHRGLELVSRAEEPRVFWVNMFCQAAFVAMWLLTSRLV